MPTDRALAEVDVVLAVLAVVVAIARLATRVSLPLPVLLVVAGLVWGLLEPLVPAFPNLALTPNLVFLVFLPPLLTSSAYGVPLAFFRANLRSIVVLAVALVIASAAVAAVLCHALIPAMPLGAAFVLGAIISPPDPAAASTITRRTGLPNRLRTILEGEGLVNDATALTTYSVALVAVATGSFSLREAAQEFVQATAGGVAVGAVVAWVASAVLRRMDHPDVEVTISLMLPYAAYVAAEQLGASGVLAAVAAGFVLRHHALRIHSAPTRLSTRAVWSTVVFVIEGFVFFLTGSALGRAASSASWRILGIGLVITLALVALRFAFVFGAAALARVIEHGRKERASELVVLGWAGMRGVVSLAATLAVPFATARGEFPERGALLVIAFEVIFITLVLQGLTLPWLVRRVGVGGTASALREEREARAESARSALECIDRLAREGAPGPAVEEVRARYRGREREDGTKADDAVARVERAATESALEAVLRLRSEGRISEEVAQRIEREFDLRRALD